MIAKVKRPLLRYFGGKFQLSNWIISHFPSHEYYAEPYAGAANILINKKPAPSGEMINDLNGDVVNLFRILQFEESYDRLIKMLESTLYSKAEYNRARSIFQKGHSCHIVRAWATCVRSFMSIGVEGNSSSTVWRMGNVDLSRVGLDGRTFRNCGKDWCSWRENLDVIRKRMQDVMVYQECALGFVKKMNSPECLIYLDPPYCHSTRSSKRYIVDGTTEMHQELVEVILGSVSKIILSGYATDLYCPLEKAGWSRVEKISRANLSNDVRIECLWINPAAQVVAPQMEMF